MDQLLKRACTNSVAVKSYIDSVIARDNGCFSKEEAERIVYDVLVFELNSFYERGGHPGELGLVITSKIVSPSVDVVDFIATMRFNTCLLRTVAGYAGYPSIHSSVSNRKLSARDFRSLAQCAPAYTGNSSKINHDLKCLIGIHHDFDGEFDVYNIIDMVKTRLGPIFDKRYLHFVYARDLTDKNGYPPSDNSINKWTWNSDGNEWTSAAAENINHTRMEKVYPPAAEPMRNPRDNSALTDDPIGTATKVDNRDGKTHDATACGIGGAQGVNVKAGFTYEFQTDSIELEYKGIKLTVKGYNGKLSANVDTLVEVLAALGIKK